MCNYNGIKVTRDQFINLLEQERILKQFPKKIAVYLSNHSNFKTHGKHINIDKAKEIGLKIENLEDNQIFQDKVLSSFHATMHCFGMTTAAKVIANHNGNCFMKQFNAGIPMIKK